MPTLNFDSIYSSPNFLRDVYDWSEETYTNAVEKIKSDLEKLEISSQKYICISSC